MQNGRRRVYILAMDNLDPKYLMQEIDLLFDSVKCEADLNLALGFVLKNVTEGSCRYYYAHENIVILRLLLNIWRKSRIFYVTPKSLNRVQENELTPNLNYRSWWMLQFFQHDSTKLPWDAKTLYC